MAIFSKRVRGMFGWSLHGWENSMVVSLIVAGAFALLAGVATLQVVRLQRVEIAESNARQREAELKLAQLRKLSGPRDINFETLRKELEGKPKAPVAIWYLPDVSDGYWFASRLQIALRLADWEVALPIPVPDLDGTKLDPMLLTVLKSQPRSMTAGGQPSGITVVGHDLSDDAFSLDTPLGALSNALIKSASAGFGMFGSGGSQLSGAPKGTLRVVIAAKLDPIFLDTAPSEAVPHK